MSEEFNQDTAEGTIDSIKARNAELEGIVAEKEEASRARDNRLREAEARINSLEQTIGERDTELGAIKQAMDQSDETLSGIKNSLAEAVTSYRAKVVQTNADIPEELITDDTIEAVDRSESDARNLVSRVKQGLEADAAITRIPAGAPQRTTPDLSTLSPREKIQYAIGGKR